MKIYLFGLIVIIFFAAICAQARTAADAGDSKVEVSLEINAPVSEVWDQSLDVKTWPQWIPMVKSASFQGETLTLGSKFKIKVGVKGMTLPFTLTVCQYEKHKSIAWKAGGPGLGFEVVRSLICEARGDKTLVTSREEFTGPIGKQVFKFITRREFESIHEQWLQAIKLKVEGARQF